MIKRKVTAASSTVLLILLAAFLFAPPQVIEISESQIAQGLEENIPYSVDSFGTTVIVNDAVVRLTDDNKIMVDAQFDAAALTLEGVGTASIESAIRYDDGKFYLSDLEHDNIEFEFSQNSQDTIDEVRSTLEGILRRETEEANDSGDASRIDGVAQVNEYYETKLQVDALDELDGFLSSFPVYEINRSSGRLWLAALALDGVEITSEKILVSLSLQTLIIRLAILAGSIMLFAYIYFSPILSLFKRSR